MWRHFHATDCHVFNSHYFEQKWDVFHSIYYYSQVNVIWWPHWEVCKCWYIIVNVVLWLVSRWCCNEVNLWFSYDRHSETALRSQHICCIVINHQMMSQWSRVVISRCLTYGNCTLKSLWLFQSQDDFAVISENLQKRTTMLTLRRRLQMTIKW